MLDPVACEQMSFGEPRASLQALIEVSKFLNILGLRSCSRSGISATEEDENEKKEAPEVPAVATDVRSQRGREFVNEGSGSCCKPSRSAVIGSERKSREGDSQ